MSTPTLQTTAKQLPRMQSPTKLALHCSTVADRPGYKNNKANGSNESKSVHYQKMDKKFNILKYWQIYLN